MVNNNIWKGITISLILILIVTNVYWFTQQNKENYSEENYLLMTLMKADADISKISISDQKAESYYNEASFAYEDGNYNLVGSNCRLARDYYSEESQGYKRIKAELKSTEIEDKLIKLYIEKLDLNSEISLNMFEACEYFESASRYYDKYFNTNVPYDDSSYDMGTGEIDMMGEKIEDHDRNVRDYNDKLEEYRVELKLRIDAFSEISE